MNVEERDLLVRRTALLEAVTAASKMFITTEMMPHMPYDKWECGARNAAVLGVIERIRECDPSLPPFDCVPVPPRES